MKGWLMLLAGVVAAGCSRTETEPGALPPKAGGRPVVATVNYPLAYFAGRMAGDAAAVTFPVPAGEDPADWEPSEAGVAVYQKADLILANGADYGRWLRTATLPEERMVDTSRGFAGAYLRTSNAVTHSHGPKGAHEHGATEGHTWLDASQALRQAEAVRDALARLIPASRGTIDANFRSLAGDLTALDAQLEEAAGAGGGGPLLASHPVYAYAARRYHWKLESMHWEPDEMPPEEEWTKLANLHARHPARIMVWEADPLPEVARRLLGMGIEAVPFETCANVPASGDYLSVMRANADRLRRAQDASLKR